MSSIINADTSGGLKLECDFSGQLEIQTAAATKVTVTSAGNVGIGTSTPAQKFVVSDGGVNFATSVSGSVQNIGTFTDNTLAVIANSVEQMRVTSAGLLSFNSGYGSVAPAYGCRAWVNFNGTGTVAIRDSANVSSITDNGTGNYTVNFTVAMVDANYSFSVAASSPAVTFGFATLASANPSVSAFRFNCHAYNGTVNTDMTYAAVSIFR